MRYEIGIDEVGRGPLAGPVSVGASLIPTDFTWEDLNRVTDSKQLSPAKRFEIYQQAKRLRRQKQLDFAVVSVSASEIDRLGISKAIPKAIRRALAQLGKRNDLPGHNELDVYLDGGLKAPSHYPQQKTVIKGDSIYKSIGLASILAKVHRDRYMEKLAQDSNFAQYGFTQHKGYGTKQHRALILEHGLSSQHRKTYCKNILSGL